MSLVNKQTQLYCDTLYRCLNTFLYNRQMYGYFYLTPFHKEISLNKPNYPSLPELFMMRTQGSPLMMKNTGEKEKGSSSIQMYSQKWK